MPSYEALRRSEWWTSATSSRGQAATRNCRASERERRYANGEKQRQSKPKASPAVVAAPVERSDVPPPPHDLNKHEREQWVAMAPSAVRAGTLNAQSAHNFQGFGARHEVALAKPRRDRMECLGRRPCLVLRQLEAFGLGGKQEKPTAADGRAASSRRRASRRSAIPWPSTWRRATTTSGA